MIKSLGIFLMITLLLSQGTIRAESLTPQERAISTAYGIDPGTKYEGSLVIRAIAAIERAAEAETMARVALAFDEGYKAGHLDAQSLEASLWVYGAVGAVVGGAIVFILMR
jgi:hypothetical protein